jgi:hypothetical protein
MMVQAAGRRIFFFRCFKQQAAEYGSSGRKQGSEYGQQEHRL